MGRVSSNIFVILYSCSRITEMVDYNRNTSVIHGCDLWTHLVVRLFVDANAPDDQGNCCLNANYLFSTIARSKNERWIMNEDGFTSLRLSAKTSDSETASPRPPSLQPVSLSVVISYFMFLPLSSSSSASIWFILFLVACITFYVFLSGSLFQILFRFMSLFLCLSIWLCYRYFSASFISSLPTLTPCCLCLCVFFFIHFALCLFVYISFFCICLVVYISLLSFSLSPLLGLSVSVLVCISLSPYLSHSSSISASLVFH